MMWVRIVVRIPVSNTTENHNNFVAAKPLVHNKPSLKLARRTQVWKLGLSKIEGSGLSGKKGIGGNYPPQYSIVKIVNPSKDLCLHGKLLSSQLCQF